MSELGMQTVIFHVQGRITRTVTCPETAAGNQTPIGSESVLILDGVRDIREDDHWIDGEDVRERPAYDYPDLTVKADGVSVAYMDLGEPCAVRFNDEDMGTDSIVEFTTNEPGEFVIEVTPSFPGLPNSFRIIAS